MHYGDKKQLKKNKLEIVVYTMGELKGKKWNLHLTSIVSCKAFNPRILSKILKGPDILKKSKFVKTMKPERYYLVEIRQTECFDFVIVDATDVTDDKNKLYFLH